MKTWCLFLLAVSAICVTASDDIPPGYHAFQTVGGGATHIDFETEPIPADFFCVGSEAYKGRIDFEGAPLATDPPGLFGRTDTIIERIDDAVFGADGTAVARVRVKALHLVNRAPLVNACGVWDARVGVTDRQPLTTMGFNRIDDETGTFSADLVLTVRFTFTNRDDPREQRILERTIHFTEFEDAPYVLRGPRPSDIPEIVRGKRHRGVLDSADSFVVDSDADGLPDAVMRIVSGGWWAVGHHACPRGVYPPDPSCLLLSAVHEADDHIHMVLPVAPSDGEGNLEPYKSSRGSALDGTHWSDFQIEGLRNHFQELEDRGLIRVSAETLLQETLAKLR